MLEPRSSFEKSVACVPLVQIKNRNQAVEIKTMWVCVCMCMYFFFVVKTLLRL